MSEKKTTTLLGTLRIKSKDLKVYEKTKSGWKKSKSEFPDALQAIKLFKASRNFDILKDKKDSTFLKGQLSPEGKCQGARINVLPSGEKIDKAFSLFAKNLTFHDQDSHDHWDVIWQNPGGTFSYVYTLEKKLKAKKSKFKKVDQFEKFYPKIKSQVSKALKDKNDKLAMPMHTLLNTYMRVGNETYYKAHGHKGLTTLKKQDIKISKNTVNFNYFGKDGVPRNITKEFPNTYITRLKNKLKSKTKNSFVFTKLNSEHPLSDMQFKEAFKRYCGHEFYPHIVRSHFATHRAKEFLKKHKKASKEEIREIFTEIAHELGHKKFDKKNQVWKDSFNVTINHYIQPEIVEKIKSLESK